MSVKSYSQLAQLAEASYADLREGNDVELELRRAANNMRFSDTQVTEFASKWSVLHHLPDTASGFSATLFESKDNPGEVVLACRGTADTIDDLYLTDVGDIALDGIAIAQVVDLYNYWKSLTTTGIYQAAKLITLQTETVALIDAFASSQSAGASLAAQYRAQGFIIDSGIGRLPLVRGIELGASDSLLGNTDLALGYGKAIGKVLTASTGHSLGGHLATAFSRVFSGLTVDVLAVNGAGFADNSNVDNLFALLGGGPSFEPSQILNVYVSAGPQLVAQDWYLRPQGGHTEIYTESADSGTTFGHGKEQMTDSLAIYGLFASLDSSLSDAGGSGIRKITNILKVGSNVATHSLESALSAIGKLFHVANTNFIGNEFDGNRELFYKALDAINQTIATATNGASNLVVVDLTSANADSISRVAFAGIDQDTRVAYRYALSELNPFAVIGIDYTDHNQNGELDLYDEATGQGAMSAQYLQDRAGLLSHVIDTNRLDRPANTFIGGDDIITDLDGLGAIHVTTKEGTTHVLNGGLQVAPNSDVWQSVDANGDFDGLFTYRYIADVNDGILLVNGGAISIEGFTTGDLGIDLADASTPPPPPPDRRVGTGCFDGLFYNSQNTGAVTLEGLGGPDVLQGGRFDDALYGDAEATFASLDTLPSSSLQGDFVSGEAGDDLLVGSSAIDVLSGGPGIDLMYAGPGDDLIYGDFGAVGQYSFGAGPQWQIVHQANPFQTYVLGAFAGANEASWLGGADFISSGSGDDTVFAGGQDDVIYGGDGADGDDTLFGEADNDLLMGDRPDQYHDFVTNDLYVHTGNDLLYGGDGNDELWGVRGNDYLYGGAGNDTLRGDSATPWFASPPMDEHGDDFLEGGTGSDTLYGDGGNDYLDGGAGDDTMFGDNDDDTDPMYHGEDWMDGGDGWDLMAGGGANDTLFGGAGHDLLMGDFASPVGGFHGDDYLDGESGDDYLIGGGGADTLFGGSGDDYLEGDADFVDAAFHGNDYLDGGQGNDALFGYGGDDQLFGGADDDYLDSSGGNDRLFGGAGVDQLFGGDGDDYLSGGAGTNHLDGGGGADTFLISAEGTHIIVNADALDTVEFAAGVAYRFDSPVAQTLANLIDASGQGELVITGDTADNTLYAMGRNTVLAGGAGNDLLGQPRRR